MRQLTPILMILGVFIMGFMLVGMMLQPSTITAAMGETPRPSPTLTTTPVPSLDLPEWISDPDVNVYVARAYGEEFRSRSASFTFFNVDTNEHYGLDLAYVDGVTWFQSPETLYIRLERNGSRGADHSEGFTEFVDTQTGQLTRYARQDDARPDQQPPPPPVISDDNPALSYAISMENIYPEVWLNTEGDSVLLENPYAEKEYRYVDVAWRGEYLQVRYWSTDSTGHYVENDDAVYNQHGEILHTFNKDAGLIWAQDTPQFLYQAETGDICFLNLDEGTPDCTLFNDFQAENDRLITSYSWTPDHSEILLFYRVGESETGGLCQFDLATHAVNCIWERTLQYSPFDGGIRLWLDDGSVTFGYGNATDGIFDTRTPRDNGLCILNIETDNIYCPTDDLLSTDYYFRIISPARDNSKIAITYTRQFGEGNDGVCIHDLETLETICPVEGDDLWSGFIDGFSWSPDGRHVVIVYTGYGPASDDKSFARFGFVDVEARIYRDQGFAMYESSPSSMWRPTLGELD